MTNPPNVGRAAWVTFGFAIAAVILLAQAKGPETVLLTFPVAFAAANTCRVWSVFLGWLRTELSDVQATLKRPVS